MFTLLADYYKHTSPEHVVRLFFSQQTAAAHTHQRLCYVSACARRCRRAERSEMETTKARGGRRRQYIKKSTERSHVRRTHFAALKKLLPPPPLLWNVCVCNAHFCVERSERPGLKYKHVFYILFWLRLQRAVAVAQRLFLFYTMVYNVLIIGAMLSVKAASTICDSRFNILLLMLKCVMIAKKTL